MTQYLVTVCARDDAAAAHSLYLLDGDVSADELARLTGALLHDPVVQQASWCALAELPPGDGPLPAALVAYKPGVTDNEAESVRLGAARLGVGGLRAVKTLRRYALAPGQDAAGLFNPLIQTALLTDSADAAARRAFYELLLLAPSDHTPQVAHVPLNDADDAALLEISRAGILALDLAEMRAVQAYFRREERQPSDGELETIAQTWSEHCSHKTFKGRVTYQGHGAEEARPGLDPAPYTALAQLAHGQVEIDSLIKTYLMAATQAVLDRGPDQSAPFVLSAFVDNAGIVAFTEGHEISFKVETHNHPSALEPFGGANTGVGGVVRDVLGVSAKPIANTDVLCFGPLDLPEAQLSPGVLHPRRIAAGVVAGVRDYGNKLGIPTVNGAVLYDPGYVANPLVYSAWRRAAATRATSSRAMR
jgi:phosphoribosylformylglycinamidine synthase subunit PurSL